MAELDQTAAARAAGAAPPPLSVAVAGGRAEGRRDPIGLHTPRPRLSWWLESAHAGTAQTGYRLQVSGTADFASPLADTGWVDDAECTDRPWPAAPLSSRQRRWWRVRARTTSGPTAWSPVWLAETGLLGADDWQGRFVTPDWDEDTSQPQPCPLLRTGFRLAVPVASARLHVTALGCYQVEINGVPIGTERLAPGWTAYQRRVLSRTHDVTSALRPGENALGAVLADGWYRGRLGFEPRRNRYGDRLALLAQLEVTLVDGTGVTIATDGGWRASTGAVRASDLYDGETVDARLAVPGWSAPGFDDSAWAGVRVVDDDLSRVVPAALPPVGVVAEVTPVSASPTGDGAVVLDFGQNLVGHLRVRTAAPAGSTIVARHAEILDPAGALRTDLLRGARATDTFVAAGAGPEVFEPRFTFHGFRYAELAGVDAGATDVTAVVVSAALERLGEFECSDPLVNRLHANTLWSLYGNFVSVPTDCPQRDERLGWTGDAQVFAPSACFLVDARAFLASWLDDVVAEQRADGAIPYVVPNILGDRSAGAAGWGDAITCMPWDLYVAYGDPEPMARCFGAMRRWVDFQLGRAGDELVWRGDFQFGDWLDPDAPANKPASAKANRDMVASAYMVRSLGTVSRAAAVLGDTAAADLYATRAEQARQAWWTAFASEARVSQTGCATALQFRLSPDSERAGLAERLHELVVEAGDHLATGFLGTPLLCAALTEGGHLDDAYRVLLQRTPPSWLYPVLQGATTIWERWDALRPDGTVPGDALGVTGRSMVSFNHYAYGAIADWLHTTVAGLSPDPDHPGYRRVVVAPRPGGGLTHARARHRSRYGPVAVSWRVAGSSFHLHVDLPPSTAAEVRLPDGSPPLAVGPGTHDFACAAPPGP